MNPLPDPIRPTLDGQHDDVRPVGAWVVGAFCIACVVAMWLLVSFVFLDRA